MENETCPICGGPATLVEEPQTMNMAGRTVTYLDRFYRCGACEATFYSREMAGESFRRAAAVIRAEEGFLAPDEIIGLRKKYGLTQAQLERLIGAGEKTVVRWERGSVARNKTADTLLRVLTDHPEVVAALKRQKRAGETGAPPIVVGGPSKGQRAPPWLESDLRHPQRQNAASRDRGRRFRFETGTGNRLQGFPRFQGSGTRGGDGGPSSPPVNRRRWTTLAAGSSPRW